MTSNQMLRDTEQNAWQLTAIQATGMSSLPVIIASILIIQKTNFMSAFITLALANFLAFFIRYPLVKMSYKGKKSTLDISREYLGETGGYVIAILLLLSTLAWYIIETNLASNALTSLIPLKDNTNINRYIQISVSLGILSTLFCMEGMVVLRLLSTISFPIILLSFLYAAIKAPHHIPWNGPISISLSAFVLAIATSLGMAADLPTFFRHSRSWKEAWKGLIFVQIISFAISIGALFLGSLITHADSEINLSPLALNSSTLKASLAILIIFSVVCANVANVYSSSVGWEIVAPVLAGRKEYLILGLGFTIIFVLVDNLFSMQTLLHITEYSLINLSYVLIAAYLIYLYVKKLPTLSEQTIYFLAWLFATCAIPFFSLTTFPFVSALIILLTLILGFSSKLVYQLYKFHY